MLYELDAFVHGKGSRLAILIDRLAGDVLEYQIRSPGGGDACVYQPGNIGVRESGEQPAFAPKTIERQGRVGDCCCGSDVGATKPSWLDCFIAFHSTGSHFENYLEPSMDHALVVTGRKQGGEA